MLDGGHVLATPTRGDDVNTGGEYGFGGFHTLTRFQNEYAWNSWRHILLLAFSMHYLGSLTISIIVTNTLWNNIFPFKTYFKQGLNAIFTFSQVTKLIYKNTWHIIIISGSWVNFPDSDFVFNIDRTITNFRTLHFSYVMFV